MRLHLVWAALRIGQIANGVTHGFPRQQVGAVVGVDERADLLVDALGPGRPEARGRPAPLPIFPGRLLRQQQRIGTVRLGGRRPQLVLVRAEADKEHAHALLRYAVVGRVHQLERDPVLADGARLVLPLAQAGQVVAPLLLRLGGQRRKLQLQQDIVEVVGEGGAREALHVLEDERARTGLAHGAHRLRKHVALVQEAAVLASMARAVRSEPEGVIAKGN